MDLSIVALKALDALSIRADLTAQNIANAGTPGYRPVHARFEDALAAAALSGDEAVRGSGVSYEREIADVSRPEMRVDLEMQTASATALRYGAIVDVLGREMALASAAVGGR